MTHLEGKVHEQFTNLQRAQGSTTSDNANGTNGMRSDSNDTSVSNAGALGPAFARVNSVVPASPADQAGLKAGDAVRSFGTVNWINHERLTKVAETVQQNEGVSIAPSFPFPMRSILLAGSPIRHLRLKPSY